MGKCGLFAAAQAPHSNHAHKGTLSRETDLPVQPDYFEVIPEVTLTAVSQVLRSSDGPTPAYGPALTVGVDLLDEIAGRDSQGVTPSTLYSFMSGVLSVLALRHSTHFSNSLTLACSRSISASSSRITWRLSSRWPRSLIGTAILRK